MAKNLLVNAFTKILEFKRKHNKLVKEVEDVEQNIPSIVEQAIQADKDIISQITMVYDEEGDYTDIIFPKGVMPLSISLNTHPLYLKIPKLVDNTGSEAEGYELDGYGYIEDDYGHAKDNLCITVLGDISEQVINSLTYIQYNGLPLPIQNTYNLFFPQTGGEEVVAYEGTSLLPTDVIFEDWTLHRAIKDGNILWIVCSGTIKNTTSSSQSLTDLFKIILPSEIAEKIYRIDGTKCSESYTSFDYVLGYPGISKYTNQVFNVRCSTPNELIIQNTTNMNANEESHFNLRIPIFLDIGE